MTGAGDEGMHVVFVQIDGPRIVVETVTRELYAAMRRAAADDPETPTDVMVYLRSDQDGRNVEVDRITRRKLDAAIAALASPPSAPSSPPPAPSR